MSAAWSNSLVPSLSLLGVKNLFDPAKSELKGISDRVNLAVSGFFHSAAFVVSEEGTGEPNKNGKKNTSKVFVIC